ncbi:MAG: glycosyltransferase family 4 protein [Candidatus Kapaibacterium sp.]
MRVATVCFSRTVGGLELATLRRGAELRERGHHVISVLPDAPDLVARAETLGLPVDRITPTLPYLDLPAARKLNIVLQREEIELILVARTRDLSTAMIAAGRDVAVVLYQQMQSGLDKHDWFHNKVFRRLDGCVAITRRGRDELAANTAIAPETISVIPYGIDTTRFSPDAIDRREARSRFSITDTDFTVGIVGGFNPGKGQREFLRALGIAAEREPELSNTISALLIGERPGDSGEYVAELRAIRDALPFADRVQLLPFADDPRFAYGALDLFVLASHSETFGMVLQEAMAMGVPVIATNAGGVPEIVTDGETGLLMEPANAEAIAEAIVKLYRAPELRAALAERARRFIVEAYDSERQYVAFEKALAEAIGRRRNG